MQTTKITTLFFICLFLVGCNANFSTQSDTENIKSTGTGISEAAALNNAFAIAVRTVAGQMVITERKVINDSLMDRMTSYSDGVITTYQKISVTQDRQGIYAVTINATVNKNKITTYLQQTITSGKVDGPGLYGYAITAQDKTITRRNLIDEYRIKLLRMGYEVELGKITLPRSGNPILGVSFKVIIKKEYLQNFKSALEEVGAVKEEGGILSCLFIDKKYCAAFSGYQYFKILDPETTAQFMQYQTLPQILISIEDVRGSTISATCVSLPSSDNRTTFVDVNNDVLYGQNNTIAFFPSGNYNNLPAIDRLVNINIDTASLNRMKNITARPSCR